MTAIEQWTEAVLVNAERAMSEGRHTVIANCFCCGLPFVVAVGDNSVSGRCVCGSGIGGVATTPKEGQGGSIQIVVRDAE